MGDRRQPASDCFEPRGRRRPWPMARLFPDGGSWPLPASSSLVTAHAAPGVNGEGWGIGVLCRFVV